MNQRISCVSASNEYINEIYKLCMRIIIKNNKHLLLNF